MKILRDKFSAQATKTYIKFLTKRDKIKERLLDTRGEFIETAIKIIIGVVIGALVLAGLLLLWNNVIMPRLNTEVNDMFNA